MDPYKILGVSEDTDQKEIKKAYRKLAAQHHPDRGGDEEKFKEVAEAYSILSDDQKRQQHHARQRGPGLGMGFEDIFGRGFPFEDFFVQQPQRKRQAKKNTEDSDVQFNLRINLEQIKRGAVQEISFKRNKICNKCSGTGGAGQKTCGNCMGQGFQVVRPAPFFTQQIPCQVCAGKGTIFDDPCHPCSTRGYVQVQDRVKIKIEEEN